MFSFHSANFLLIFSCIHQHMMVRDTLLELPLYACMMAHVGMRAGGKLAPMDKLVVGTPAQMGMAPMGMIVAGELEQLDQPIVVLQ